MRHITETVWISSQNLTDAWGNKPPRHIFWHGRAWLHGERRHIRLSWSHGKDASLTRAMIDLAGGDTGRELTFSVGLKRVFLWFLTFDFPWFEKWMPGKMVQSSRDGRWFKMPVERNIGVRFFNDTLWLSLWENPNESSRDDSWWWALSVNFPDLFLGCECRVSSEVIEQGTGVVSMPEGDYQADYSIKRSIYKRPRWRRRVLETMVVDLPVPIPVPGKGENSWDCGDDAIWSVAFNGANTSVEQAMNKVRDGALRDRERYGGKRWVPAEGWVNYAAHSNG